MDNRVKGLRESGGRNGIESGSHPSSEAILNPAEALSFSAPFSLDYNLHTHTKRCRHAKGCAEDYIKESIKMGIKHLGFSDHAPYVFPDGYENHYRIPLSEAEEYVREIDSLRQKYAKKIEISVGFEMEYYPRYFDEMLEIARKVGAEYLVLGQHFILNEHPNGIGAIGPTDSEERLSIYVNEVVEAMEKGVFTYVAHPDLTCFTGDEAVYRCEIERMCLASREMDIPLEINLGGIRYDKHYPADTFWQIAGEVNAPVTIGYDLHDYMDIHHMGQLPRAFELIKKHRLNYVGMAKLRDIYKHN